MNFRQELKEKTALMEEKLQMFLPKEEGFQKTVIEAMNYSLLAGGKRLRPMLMWETYRLFGGQALEIDCFVAAIEMIHTYSLVHDDLPAMDNDEYRRGRKTTHIVYGEAMAILAGDGLLNLAFETASRAFDLTNCPARVGKAMQILSGKAGINGMLGGQCSDVESEGKEISKEQLEFIHDYKTSAMLQASMMIGATLAGASEEEIEISRMMAQNIGMAFQIQDDILDVTGSSKELGKTVGSDEKNQKNTFVTMVGLPQAKREVERYSNRALELLHGLHRNSEFLEALIIYLINRKK